MNPHLNVFRYYNESNAAEFIENNLSRAFALCLQYDSLFFNRYLQEVLSPEDFGYLFNYYEKDAKYSIDLQVNTNTVELTGIKKVYAIAMTSDRDLDISDFLELSPTLEKTTNLTDVFILIKDIAFVIEVKRDAVDCRRQLFDQVFPFIDTKEKINVQAKNFSWRHTVFIMEQVANIHRFRSSDAHLLTDFLNLAELRYPYWFSSRPFGQLSGLIENSPKSIHARYQRLRQILDHSNQKLLDYNDRMAMGVDFGWASEVIPKFEKVKGLDCIIFTIWPGNTKGQGYYIYNKPLDWCLKDTLSFGGYNFAIETKFHLKFSHFNKYVTSLDFNSHALQKSINTPYNFYNNSGKWNIDDWTKFEAFMDEHFKEEFSWREKSKFKDLFLDSDRNYFTMSLGFIVELYVPLRIFQEMDNDVNDYDKIGKFVDELVLGLKTLI